MLAIQGLCKPKPQVLHKLMPLGLCKPELQDQHMLAIQGLYRPKHQVLSNFGLEQQHRLGLMLLPELKRQAHHILRRLDLRKLIGC
jgi:hypothetical protein